MIQFVLQIKAILKKDGAQNYLIFQPMERYFKRVAGFGSDNYIYIWKSKGLSGKKLNSITASNCSITLLQ